ncbi:hypothetical protein E4U56_003921 [Claviceps arundinis]|uniref:Extradiol ring-cleavage dioxygenase class III enzyme subunit B domain-containing protein n=1 Tax=Claviceps arundinis TaxID=1623583 RepID=A0A9P7MN74_9HYPO|nr:hypothetical protein E4U56_003921 [Claviceps arundinis]
MKRTSTRNLLRAAALITFPFPYQNRLALSLAHQPDMPIAPVIALSHGGGPLPLLGDKNHDAIVSSLRNKVPQILRLGTSSAPKAMVLVTAHWSANIPSISSSIHHELYYDYYGFPPEAYTIKYPAKGDPTLASEIKDLLEQEGLSAQLDASRGWDHGVFVPLSLINPAADIPVVQLSVLESENPEEHLRMGKALRRLRERNIAIVGSGFASLHNMRELMGLRGGNAVRTGFKALSDEWNGALTKAVMARSESERWTGLMGWRGLPHSERMHPLGGGEHFMPLVVCAGAAGDGEEGGVYRDEYMGIDIFTYYWGGRSEDGGRGQAEAREGKEEL